MMFEEIVRLSNLQATQIKEAGQYLQASDMSPLLNRDLYLQVSSPKGIYQSQWTARKGGQIKELLMGK